MELLNLDELVTTRRQVTLKGTVYDIAEQSVEQMLAATKLTKLIENKSNDAEKVMEAMMKVAGTIIPDCPVSVLNQLRFEQLNALINFASATDEQVVAEANSDSEDKFTTSEKKS